MINNSANLKRFLPLEDLIVKNASMKPLNSSVQIFIDTGCSVIFGPPTIMSPIIDLFPKTLDCNNSNVYPNITFVIQGDDYQITPAEYVLKLSENECVLGIQAVNSPELENMILMGDPFFKAFYAHMDFGKKRIGLAKAQ